VISVKKWGKKMSPLLTVVIAFLIGFIEWYMALRRTLALTRGEKTLTFILVLGEGLLAWGVLSGFLAVPSYEFQPVEINSVYGLLTSVIALIKAYYWKILVALSASVGGAIGSLVVVDRDKNNFSMTSKKMAQ
jgi:hypothetical protein